MSNKKYGIISFSDPAHSYGFFSAYFSIISTIIECDKLGLLPYVDTTKSWFNPTFCLDNVGYDYNINPWNWWFEQYIEPNAETIQIPIYRDYLSHNPMYFAKQPNLKMARDIAEKYCIIKPFILEEENMLYNIYLKDKISLGILARGTEFLTIADYPKVKLENWKNLINDYLKKYTDINNIFLVSDDDEIINEITKHFNNVVYIKNFFRKTNQTEEEIKRLNCPWWLFSPTNDPNHRNRLGVECLIQAKLLSKCDYFLGTHSGISNAAQFFNYDLFKNVEIV